MITSSGVAQPAAVTTYTLLSGSKLTDECPICARAPIVVPLTGTFGLQMLDQSPLATRYALTNISFRSGATSGPQYEVTGTGVYEVGGEVAPMQQLFMNTEISNGTTTANALLASTNGPVVQPWPKIQIQVKQTNSTPAQQYSLALLAVPAPHINAIVPDPKTGNVLFEWEANGGSFQLERASNVLGSYSAVTPITTNLSFTDLGVLTNSTQFFYRLRPF
jgi:hypothetical protein